MITQATAIKKVEKAIAAGKLVRGDTCEICQKSWFGYQHVHGIIAHHWNGYNDPLNVWWICRSCNRILAHKHDGSLTREQARAYIKQRWLVMLGLA